VTPGATYGSVTNPIDPGSGGGGNDSGTGNNGGPGGGAVLIQAGGSVTIDGSISANGGNMTGYGGGGSGGGIGLFCSTFGGTGTLSAVGGNGNTGASQGGGGGGRIAINFDRTAQAGRGASGVLLTAASGNQGSTYAQNGTLYLTDSSLLTASPVTVIRHSGRLFMAADVTNWVVAALTITNAAFAVPIEGFQLVVSNDLTIVGGASASSLELGNRAARTVGGFNYDFLSVTTNGPALAVGGRLLLTNNATLYVLSGVTNGVAPDYGARVSVTGDVVVSSNCWVYPYSHYSNGGSVFFEMRDLVIATNAGVDASRKGWAGGVYVSGTDRAGFGPGRGLAREIGGGYGGNAASASAGNGGLAYGASISNTPTLPGSGGAAQDSGTCGGDGGGLIWVQAGGSITLNGGVLKADGGQSVSGGYAGKGSGGGIYLRCRRFGGASGSVTANGGTSGTQAGGGGGGRVAVWRQYDNCQFTNNVTVTKGYNAQDGTLVWGQLPSAPWLDNQAASGISYTYATLNGSLLSTGTAPTAVWVYWGLTDGTNDKAAWTTNTSLGVMATNTLALATNLTGLLSGTNYYYRFYASNAVGETWAVPTVSFLTPAASPTISNAVFGATNVTLTSACLNGYLVATGTSPTAVSVYWGPSDAGTNAGAAWAYTNDLPGYASVGPVSATVSPPLSNAWYYYRFTAQNSGGRVIADPVSMFVAGEVWAQATAPSASMNGLVPGTVTVSRASAVTNQALTVRYAVGGTAAPGSQYTLNPAGTSVVMAVGVSSVAIAVNPVWDDTMLTPRTVTLTLLPGLYAPSPMNSATVTIAGASYAPGSNATVQAGDWGALGTWSQGRPPVAGDSVYIAHNTTISNASRSLSALTVLVGRTLTFYGTNTSATAPSMTFYGTVTHAAQSATNLAGDGNWYPDNRVWVVGSNLTIAAGAAIDVSAKGYQGGLGADGVNTNRGCGPGGGRTYGGGGYGGNGAWHGSYAPLAASFRGATPPGATYGAVTNPVDPGSGGGGNDSGAGNNGGAGGGAVLIQASGAVTVNGSINANGGNYAGSYGGGGSGGGISISCRTFGGSGTLTAGGGSGAIAQNYGGGGGGRIAVNYDRAAQAAQGAAGVIFSVAAGNNGSTYAPNGTLYLPDTALLTTAPLTVFQHVGRLLFDPSVTSWAVSALTITNSSLTLPIEGFQLIVSNDLTIVGSTTAGSLELGTRAVRVDGGAGYHFLSGTTNGPSLVVGGRLQLTNNAALYVFSGMANMAGPSAGARVTVANDVILGTNCWIYPYSHYTNGGSVCFSVRSLGIATNAGINADGKGWSGGSNPGNGVGYGYGNGPALQAERSAGYGGKAGAAPDSGGGGLTYGSSNAPTMPGSGGAAQAAGNCGGSGGGLIWVEASGSITLSGGTLTANGERNLNNSFGGGGGSGGGIYLTCRRFGGDTGSLRANGATGITGSGTGGGGGRIAVWRIRDSCLFTNNITASGGTGTQGAGADGTIFWGQLREIGTVITVR
jgi:hypothetical protein